MSGGGGGRPWDLQVDSSVEDGEEGAAGKTSLALDPNPDRWTDIEMQAWLIDYDRGRFRDVAASLLGCTYADIMRMSSEKLFRDLGADGLQLRETLRDWNSMATTVRVPVGVASPKTVSPLIATLHISRSPASSSSSPSFSPTASPLQPPYSASPSAV